MTTMWGQNPYLPEADDIQAVEEDPTYPTPVVAVTVEGPVRTEQLPARGGDSRTVKVQAARAVAAPAAGTVTFRYNEDARRSRMTLIATDQPFYYGFTQEAVEGGTAAIWPINVPLPIQHAGVFFLASANAAGSTVSIIREDFAL